MAASAVPAMACGGGLFQSSCSPCGQAYVSPCAQQAYVPEPVYSGCNTGCGGWAHERLPEPEQQYEPTHQVHQYYYADQGPTYTGPGNLAPYRTYREGGWSGYHHRPHHYGYGMHHYRPWHHTGYGYGARYGYTPRHNMRYGAPMGMPHHYGEHVLRRYY
jgi:hypothetical protein